MNGLIYLEASITVLQPAKYIPFLLFQRFFLTKRFFAQPGKTGFSVLGSFSRIIEDGLKPISAEKSSKKENVEIIQVIDSCLETHSFSPAAKKRPAVVI